MLFNGNMLALARQMKKKSQSDLLDVIGSDLTQGVLSKIERGRVQPSDDLVLRFAQALSVRPSFFANESYVRQPPMSYHRKRSKLLSRDLSAIHGISEVLRLSLAKCLDSIEFEHDGPSLPSYDLDQFGGDAREAARSVRSRLKLPRGPVRNLATVIERSGVIILPFNFGTDLIDGFCQSSYGGLPPVIFLNSTLSIDRMRFSLAHELAHLVCHDAPNPNQEMEANQFASEFLMPTADIVDDFDNFTLSRAVDLKLYWGTSIQSIVYKCWQTGKISDEKLKNYFIEMSRRGWRKNEPVEAVGFIEKPSVFASIVEAHFSEMGYSEEELADLFGLSLEDLRFYYPVKKSRPGLRVVASN